MLSFKEFFSQDKIISEEAMTNELIGAQAEKLDDLKNNLLGRRSKTKIMVNHSEGVPVVFGTEPRTNRPFVSDGNNKHYDIDTIKKMYGNSPEGKAYSDVLTHMDKVISPKGGVYSGKYLGKFRRGEKGGTMQSGGISVNSRSADGQKAKNALFSLVVDMKGNKPADHTQLGQHPDVHVINPQLEVSPQAFTPEHQHAYNHHMMLANKAYRSLKPDALETLGAHSEEINKFISQFKGDKPPKTSDYMKHLSDSHAQDAESKLSPKQKDRVIRRLNKLHSTVPNHMDKVLQMQWNMGRAQGIIKNIINSHPRIFTDNGATLSVHRKGQIEPI